MITLKNFPHFILSFILAVGFSQMGHTSCVDDLIKDIKRSPILSTEQAILKSIETFPHGSLLVAKGYSEEQLVSNWTHLLQFLTKMGREDSDYKAELESQQTEKIKELDHLSFYTMPDIFPPQFEESAYRIAIAQVRYLAEILPGSDKRISRIESLLNKHHKFK